LPQLPVVGVTVSRSEEDQRPKVQGLAERTADLLGVKLPPEFKVELWDEYFGPRYGEPNAGTLAAVKLLASQEGLLLDPVYTGKAMAGMLDGIGRGRFDEGPIIFLAYRWGAGVVCLQRLFDRLIMLLWRGSLLPLGCEAPPKPALTRIGSPPASSRLRAPSPQVDSLFRKRKNLEFSIF
jgi:hypothetical protein